MKERPIIFSSESVRAILELRKTQTRRVVKPNKKTEWLLCHDWVDEYIKDPDNYLVEECPYGKPGDTLWVREKWRIVEWGEYPYRIEYADGTVLDEPGNSSDYDNDAYARLSEHCTKDCDNAGLDVDSEGYYILKDGVVPTGWRSPMYMPRWASRIALEITDVRVDRLQDITFRDLQAEALGIQGELTKAMEEYIQIWDSLNSKRGYPWSNNPWVWCLTFKVTP